MNHMKSTDRNPTEPAKTMGRLLRSTMGSMGGWDMKPHEDLRSAGSTTRETIKYKSIKYKSIKVYIPLGVNVEV